MSSLAAITVSDLQGYPLLKDVDEAYLAALSSNMHMRVYDRKQVVLKKGESAKELMFLHSGQLQVVDTSNDGKDVGLCLITVGSVFGHVALIDGQPRSSSVVATQPSSVACLSKALALKLFYDHPVVMHRLLIEFAGIIRNTNSFRSVLSQSHAGSRVFSVLASLMQPNVAGMMTIEKMPRQQELAIMASTSRETVSRTISQLITKGIVEKDLRRLIIRQPEQLLLLADDEGSR
ncbi:MAG: Crp/Fnr family transcriptional regulator [Thiotrichales bacterium]|nr:Crp/Fnr family transcriptional regulator [Thiotrichales bacterium]